MYYAGLDVSLNETFVSIIDGEGAIVAEKNVSTNVDELSAYLKNISSTFKHIGIESGQLSIPLCKGLAQQNLPVICVDARHMATALSSRINKNDRNDARGIAQMLRAGLYKKVQIKSDAMCELKLILGSRRQLVRTKLKLMGTIRGLLKIYGIKIGTQSQFCDKTRDLIQPLSDFAKSPLEALLSCIEKNEKALKKLENKLITMGKKDEDCKRLMTIPGVGIITAMTFKVTLDNPERFKHSESVGAYLGLTPRQYASGEVKRQGSISKVGSKECRAVLYEAALSLLIKVKKPLKLKSWGLKLAKKKGNKKAFIAVARKLAVIMHRILIDKKDFCDQ
jgi:transposase